MIRDPDSRPISDPVFPIQIFLEFGFGVGVFSQPGLPVLSAAFLQDLVMHTQTIENSTTLIVLRDN